MKRLDRYLLKEMITPLFIGTIVIVLMFHANMLIALYKDYQLSSVPAQAILQLLIYKTPQFLQMTLPVGIALASSLAVSRLVRESELTAIRVAGVPILRVLLPVAIAGVAMSAVNFYVSETLMPRTERQARKLMSEVGVLALAPQFRSDVVLRIQTFAAWIGSVQREADDSLLLHDILLVERRGNDESIIINAQEGTYRNGVWEIKGARTLQLKGTTVFGLKSNTSLVLNERISIPDFMMTAQTEEQSIEELRTQIDSGKRTGRDTRWIEVNLYTRYSIPISCLVFSITGPAMAILFSRRGAFAGILASLVLAWVYFNMHVVSTQILGRNGWVSPVLAAWLPDLVLFIVGIVIIRRLE